MRTKSKFWSHSRYVYFLGLGLSFIPSWKKNYFLIVYLLFMYKEWLLKVWDYFCWGKEEMIILYLLYIYDTYKIHKKQNVVISLYLICSLK